MKNKGDIRADLLARALRMVDGSLVQDYSPLFEDLRAEDPADRRGVLADYDINMLFIRARESERTTRTLEAPLWEFDAFLDAHPALSGEFAVSACCWNASATSRAPAISTVSAPPRAANTGSGNSRTCSRSPHRRLMLRRHQRSPGHRADRP